MGTNGPWNRTPFPTVAYNPKPGGPKSDSTFRMAPKEQDKNAMPIDLETGSRTSGDVSKKDSSPPAYRPEDARTTSSVAQEDGAEIDLTPLSWW